MGSHVLSVGCCRLPTARSAALICGGTDTCSLQGKEREKPPKTTLKWWMCPGSRRIYKLILGAGAERCGDFLILFYFVCFCFFLTFLTSYSDTVDKTEAFQKKRLFLECALYTYRICTWWSSRWRKGQYGCRKWLQPQGVSLHSFLVQLSQRIWSAPPPQKKNILEDKR